MKRKLHQWFFRWFPHYERLELRVVSYPEADQLIRNSEGQPEAEQWVIAREEDKNRAYGVCVFLERRRRILE